MSGRTILKDMLDKNASHHLSITQPAPHPSAADNADPQGLAWLSEELHSEEGNKISMQDSHIFHFRGCDGGIDVTCPQN